MTCDCGSPISAGALYCRECFALLFDVEARTPLKGNEHLLVLMEACEQLASGEATIDEFNEFLDGFTVELAEREAGIHTVDIPPYLEADFAEEREYGLTGVERCNKGLDMLRGLSDGIVDMERIKAALAQFYEGFCLVSEAMAINRRNRNRPIWG